MIIPGPKNRANFARTPRKPSLVGSSTILWPPNSRGASSKGALASSTLSTAPHHRCERFRWWSSSADATVASASSSFSTWSAAVSRTSDDSFANFGLDMFPLFPRDNILCTEDNLTDSRGGISFPGG